ncbi:DUF1905 domain-containing protein [Novosphingobium sp. BW1]|uniref:DUF1905 domain-containing protein n=1 Tax=Novosphingobium sp. BW1 TaxID=2592621 RepID=UPI0011DECA16|nr:DUF1905 domain-containing protein [Novosphingobium sp. BW1]TYC86294.1 DUF1905 domain-containing protein [Novosphingobium sp. BW1]
MTQTLTHTAPLWRWTGGANGGTWYFLSITGANAETLSATALMRKLEGLGRGFGSIKVQARIGATRFATSAFPSKGDGAWLLPVKAAVRKAEDLAEDGPVEVELTF